MKSFRERLIELREEYDLSKVDLAKRIGKSKSAITRYETGEIQPTLDVLLKIKQSFGVSLDWLAGYEVEKSHQYNQVMNECQELDIDPEKLHQLINVLKK